MISLISSLFLVYIRIYPQLQVTGEVRLLRSRRLSGQGERITRYGYKLEWQRLGIKNTQPVANNDSPISAIPLRSYISAPKNVTGFWLQVTSRIKTVNVI
jgi:hypothetical protein